MTKLWAEFKGIVIGFVLSRLILFGVGILAIQVLPFKFSFPYVDQILVASGSPEAIWHWANFDGVHYLDIAKRGYAADGLQVFFPLFPLAVRIVAIASNNFLISGLLVSNLAFILAACLLYRYTKKNFSEKTAKWSIVFLFTFPTAFFFGSVYGESLFIMLLMFSLVTTGIVSGIFAGLSGGVRLVGFAVAPIVFLNNKRKNWWAVFSGLGLAGYVSYLWFVYHRPMGFLESQVAFKNARATSLSSLVSPFQVVYRYLKIFATASPAHFDFWVAALEFSAFSLGLAILGYCTFRMKINKGLLIFSWVALLLPMFSGTLQSFPRYLLVLVPIYICLGNLRSNKLKYGLVVLFSILQTVLVTLFVRGYFVA